MLLSLHRAAATAALLVCVSVPWAISAGQDLPPVPSTAEPAAAPQPPIEPTQGAEPALPPTTGVEEPTPAAAPTVATTPAAKVVLLPVEFTVYQLGVAGPEAVPDWTSAARENLNEALKSALQGRAGLEIVPLPALTEPEQKTLDAHIGVARLVVYEGSHMGGKVWATRRADFDRQLGPGLAWLGERSGADYGVLVAGSQYEQSGGLVFAQVLAAASGFIVSPGGGTNISTALINLVTGEVTWFNSTFAVEVLGISKVDFRKVESSAAVLRELMAPYPRIPSLEIEP
jgi:hypothetical protein